MIKPYLRNVINNHKLKENGKFIQDKTQGKWKIQENEIHTMQTKIHNLEIMLGSETDKIIKELF